MSPLRNRAFLSLLAVAAPLTAQTTTSPRGFDAKEGNTVFFHWATATGRRLQGIDDGWRTRPRLVPGIAFRRDGAGGSTARTLDIKVTMAECNMALVSSDLSRNQHSNVYANSTLMSFAWPDWSAAAVPPPAKFDATIKFPRPWVYTGAGALLWDVEYSNASSNSLSATDRDYTAPTTSAGTVLGTGCAGMAHDMRLENSGPGAPSFGMRIRFDGTSANRPAFLLLAAVDSNLTVPGLCTTLRALPILPLIPVGSTTPGGTLPAANVCFPYIAGLQGLPFVTQLLVLDPTQPGFPAKLSNGRRATMPSNASVAAHDAMYAWHTLGGSTTGTTFGGSLVVDLK
jgi:hypothetical protein